MLYLSRVAESQDLLHTVFVLWISALGVISGYYIYKNDPRSLRWLEGFFGVGLAYGLVLFISAWRTHGTQAEQFREIFHAGRVTLYNLGWWTYFKYSERVRNTFGKNI